MSLRLPNPRPASLLALIVFVQTTSGCLSNEYVIPGSELQRLAALPPELRGNQVRVIQELGERRGDAIDATPDELSPPVAAEPEAGYGDGQVNVDLHVDSSGGGSGGGSSRSARTHSGWRAPQNVGSGGGAPSGGWRGSPPGSSGGAFRGTPPAGSGGGSGGGRISSSGFGSIGGGGGGGGGKGGEALVVLAVVIVALAAVASVFLVASEGMRFDGWAQMHPDQPLHLKTASGGDRTVTLGTLTAAEAASAEGALVMDDEAPGLRRLDSVSLNRKGLAFKVDAGTSAFSLGPYDVNGMASHVQLGFFLSQRLGLMFDATLSGAGAGDIVTGQIGEVSPGTLIRHSLALELQAFPLDWRWFHLGAFAKGGFALIGTPASPEEGPIVGGGALVEIAVTSRLALTLRAGVDAASLNSGWSPAGVLTGGVAIY